MQRPCGYNIIVISGDENADISGIGTSLMTTRRLIDPNMEKKDHFIKVITEP